MLRRSGLFYAIALCLGLIFVACSTDTGNPVPQPGAPPVSATGRRLIVAGEDSASLAAFEKTKSLYAAAGLSVDIVRRDPAAIIKDLLEETPRPPYDLLIVPSWMLGELVENGLVQPIDVFIKDPSSYDPRLFDSEKDVVPDWWSQLSWYHGRPYGYPFQLRPMSLWYREDLFEDEDESTAFERRFGRPMALPRSASELEQVVTFFHRPQEGLYGTVIAGRSRSLVSDWLTYAAMFGARMLDTPKSDAYGDIVVNSPQAIRATEFLLGLLRFSPPEARRYDEMDAVRGFETRRIALGVMRHDLAFMGPQPDGNRRVGGIVYAPAPIPPDISPKPAEGETFLIPARTPQAREAFAFMQWALSQDAQVAQLLNGGLSTRPSSYADSRVTTLPKTYPSRPFMQILMFPSLVMPSVTILTPKIPEADRLLDAMQPELARIVAGEATPKAGLDRIAVRLGQILEGKAKLRYRAR
jgi:multiple sugar transport system substrate-binding protein